jgi:hypothetical protein
MGTSMADEHVSDRMEWPRSMALPHRPFPGPALLSLVLISAAQVLRLGSLNFNHDEAWHIWQTLGSPHLKQVIGAPAVAETFKGRARVAQLALIDGAVGAVWAPGGRPRVVFGFKLKGGKIVEIDLLADPARLDQLDLVILDS